MMGMIMNVQIKQSFLVALLVVAASFSTSQAGKKERAGLGLPKVLAQDSDCVVAVNGFVNSFNRIDVAIADRNAAMQYFFSALLPVLRQEIAGDKQQEYLVRLITKVLEILPVNGDRYKDYLEKQCRTIVQSSRRASQDEQGKARVIATLNMMPAIIKHVRALSQ